MTATSHPLASDGVKLSIASAVEKASASLIDLSHRIHAHPELAFEERRASGWVAQALNDAGFATEVGCFALETAVKATVGSGPMHVAICAEYDALPGIGHACGHNIIAAAAVGAALGLAPVADDLGLTVTVLGTPAEESGGGKILMLERGAFSGLDAAMMVHPAPLDTTDLAGSALANLDIVYRGKASHAGALPHLGHNAADAMTIAQVALGLLRQQIMPSDRISGYVSSAGAATNIIPDLSRARWTTRSDTIERLHELTARVRRCFEAGATASGCELDISAPYGPYANVVHNQAMIALYRANALKLGRDFPDSPLARIAGPATDMGNVSHVVPTLHPMIGLDCLPAVNHQPEFTAACITTQADKAVLDGATAMAWTAADLATAAPAR